jgi:organic radical activating enzyme
MSPKANTEIKLRKGSEVKVVYPQKNLSPDNFNVLDFKNFYIQPMDSENYEDNVSQSVKYCMQNPNWKLSLQTHKILGIR